MDKDLVLRVGTVGDLIRERRTIWLDCAKRHHSAEMDPTAVAAAHGSDLAVQRFLERTRCTKCGARYPEVDLKVPPVSRGGLPMR